MKPMWDKIMPSLYGYSDRRAVMIGADASGLKTLAIVRLDSERFLVAVEGVTTPIADDAKHLVFGDGYAHFEVIFPLEEYPGES